LTLANPRKIPLEARGGVAVLEGFGPSAEVDLRTSIRPTVAEVDLGAVGRNVDRIATAVSPAAVWAVVKGDAYGHGAVPVARAIADRSNALAVSLVEEGLELRAAGVRIPVVVLGAFYDHCHDLVLEQRLTPVVYDPNDLDLFAAAARGRGRPDAVDRIAERILASAALQSR